MAKETYGAEVARITEVLPELLNHIAPFRENGGIPTQYLLVVNGRVPWGERTRSSQAACRSALRRLLRRRMYDVIYYPTRRTDNPMPREQWRRYERPALELVIKQLEASGVVEYRASNFNQQGTGLSS